ncbi:MAG: GntR family transcriptional regulator [Oscillospiraceae bacterium]|nr:GntR family transcriptional regulator [Oscillospiraceae bacterium]
MNIIINNTSGVPIYEQIYTQLKNEIISGALKEDEPLPSIRGLAKGLRISVITTKRAYEELERSGYIYTLTGKGSFVAKRNTELIREEYLKKIENHLERISELARAVNIGKSELIDMLNALEED